MKKCFHPIISEKTAYEGAGSFVLFREEMGGRQSGRLITSDGKSFPCQTITTTTVQSIPSSCLYLYLQRQLYVSSCSVTHLNFNILSILLCSPSWQCQYRQPPQIFHSPPSLHQSEAFWSLGFCSDLSWHVTMISRCMIYGKDTKHPFEWIFTQHAFNPDACVMESCNQQNILYSEAV